MPKSIKFNLMLDDKPVRDIEGLKENFNIGDLFKHYESGTLQRWLKVRNLDGLADKVNLISEEDDIKVSEELIKIFEIGADPDEIRTAVYSMVFLKEKENRLKEFEKKSFNEKIIINKYHEDYSVICRGLISHNSDYPFIKSSLRRIKEDFYPLYQLNYPDIFYSCLEKSPLAVLGILANEKLREMCFFHTGLKASLEKLTTSLFTERKKPEKPPKKPSKNDEPRTLNKILDKLISQKKQKNYTHMNHIFGLKVETISTSKTEFSHTMLESYSYKKMIIIGVNRNPPPASIPMEKEFIYLHENPNIIFSDNVRFNDTYMRYSQIGADFFAISMEELSSYVQNLNRNSSNKTKEFKKEIDIPHHLSRYIKKFSGETDSYWKDIEPVEKKYMIIKMESGDFVRSAGKQGEELSAKDVDGNFPILNGIDYKSKNASHVLYYMEV